MRYGRWLAALALLAVAAIGLGACSQREATIVEQAFTNEVKSGQLVARLTYGGRPMVEMKGPFRSNGADRLPSFDWEVDVVGDLTGRVISTGKNVFVVYKGVTYEVGEDKVAKFERQGSPGDEIGSLQELQDRYGIDLKSWFSDTSTKEDAHAAGVSTTRVTGKLDVDRALSDFSRLMKQPGVRAQSRVDSAAFDQLKGLVRSARFTLDVGREDHKLRQLKATIGLREGALMDFVLQFREVDKPVTIDAPANGRPIGELMRKIEEGFKKAA